MRTCVEGRHGLSAVSSWLPSLPGCCSTGCRKARQAQAQPRFNLSSLHEVLRGHQLETYLLSRRHRAHSLFICICWQGGLGAPSSIYPLIYTFIYLFTCSLFIYLIIYLFVFMFIIYIYIYIYVCMYVCICICIYIYICICIYMCVCIYMDIYIYICVYIIYIYIYACVCVCVFVCVRYI